MGRWPLGLTVLVAIALSLPSASVSALPSLVTTIDVGGNPLDIAVDHTNHRVYVSIPTQNSVRVVDTVTNQVVANVPVGVLPHGLAVDPLTNRVYAANIESDSISVIDSASNSVVATIPVGEGGGDDPEDVVIDPELNRLFTVGRGAGMSVIDLGTGALVDTIDLGCGGCKKQIALNTLSHRVYATGESSDALWVVDGVAMELLQEKLVHDPMAVAVSEPQNRVYVTSRHSAPTGGDSLYIIDGTTNSTVTVLGGTPSWAAPLGVEVSDGISMAYVSVFGGNRITAVDLETDSTVGDVAVGNNPIGIGILPGVDSIYVANSSGGSVSVLSEPDADSDQISDLSDNCPSSSNSTQADTDTDSFGDACDADDDNDLIGDADETACGSDPLDVTPPLSRPERVDGAFEGVDDDGDTVPDEALPGGASAFDCDGDGFTGAAENHVFSYVPQTDGDQKTCQEYDAGFPAQFPGRPYMPSLRWPADLNSTAGPPTSHNRINILDLTTFIAPMPGPLNTSPGDAGYNVRWDLAPGANFPFTEHINITDLTALVAGSTGNPPMLGGVRSFGGPVCPWAP
jgi:YVTN family beta-propeller protein